jgi:sulfur-oxidizing protein SoxY
MERRNFLSITFGALALAVVPASVRAEDFRKSKPTVWTAKTVDEGIKALYGKMPTASDKVKVVAPKVASNGGAIPVDITSDIDAKTVALFQDANPESAVAVFEVGEFGIVDYLLKIKMKKSGTLTAIVEGKDGNLYSATMTLDVALGGCEG